MDGESLLTAAIEVGIALAGFSGIVAVLGRRTEGGWSIADKIRLQLLLQTSFSTILFAMLPLFLLSMRIAPSSIWRISSGIWLVYIAVDVPVRMRQIARSREESAETISTRYVASLAAGLMAVFLVQLLNAVSLAQAWPHLLAVIWTIVVAFIQFIRLLRGIWQAE
jgi:hypothetical protein